MDQIISGFTLKNSRCLCEMGGTIHEFTHERSGARLVWLDRKDENMTFAIGFKTIPTDSTGVFHILEHSVLCGSDKYPAKEPFVELLKSSLQTFLNAFTFPDRTVYPVSSRNKQDFKNLMKVYMDAVLHPVAVRDHRIFRQEGWRFELPDGENPMFQGVVYNEMKGAYSNVRAVLEQKLQSALFPDNCYRHDSGGDPEHIPELTYEQFLNSHATYYHPSNARIFLDGALDLEDTLAFLDERLGEYSRQEMDFPIPDQEPKPYRELTAPYEIGAEEDPANKTMVAWGRIAASFADKKTQYGLSILSDYLCGSSEAPLKRAVLDAGLGADMQMKLHDGMQQCWLGWEVWNTEPEKTEKICAVVREMLEKLVQEGLDRERLEACVSSQAFALQDRDGVGFPRGLYELLAVMDSWNYDGDPSLCLSYREDLAFIREHISQGWFEKLIEEHLLRRDSGVLLTLVPSRDLGRERVEKEQDRLAKAWGALSEEEKTAAKALCENIRVWQQTPDTPEVLATMPLLTLEDIAADPKPLAVTHAEVAGVPALIHGLDSGLCYVNLCFNASDLTGEELPLLSFLGTLLGKLGTDGLAGAKLETLVKQKLGKLETSAEVFGKGKDAHQLQFTMRCVMLPENLEEGLALVREILTHSKFEDAVLVRDLLRQQNNTNQMRLISGGNQFAMTRTAARETSAGAAKELLSGFAAFQWVNAACEADADALLEKLGALAGRLISRSRLTLSVSANAAQALGDLVEAIPDRGGDRAAWGSVPVLEPCREGILVSAGVAYAAKGANIGSFSGRSYVLANLVSYAHLWNAIRVQGGAYGAGLRCGDNGDVCGYSYRDPNPSRSLECFDAAAEFVENLSRSGEKLDKFILGAMSEADLLKDASGKMRQAEGAYFRGISYADMCREFRELRSTSWEDLRELAGQLKAVAAKNNYCVVGGQEQLNACGDKLEKIISLQA